MKKVLITGKNSYIGKSVLAYLDNWPDKFETVSISVRDDGWKELDFSEYDSILHVAGIAHADTGKISEDDKKQYYKVNCDLTFEIAQKFKKDRCGKPTQFIYMSSIIVYDDKVNIRKKRIITPSTKPNPSSFYGDSKLQAEEKLKTINNNEAFDLVIIRPPMIYGGNSKGNYPVLKKIALKLPFFPKVVNERSMLFIDNLSELIRKIILNGTSGTYYPQNKEKVATHEVVSKIANAHGHKIKITPAFNWFIYLLGIVPGKIGRITNKAFGNLIYTDDLSEESYQLMERYVDFETSIYISESKRT